MGIRSFLFGTACRVCMFTQRKTAGTENARSRISAQSNVLPNSPWETCPGSSRSSDLRLHGDPASPFPAFRPVGSLRSDAGSRRLQRRSRPGIAPGSRILPAAGIPRRGALEPLFSFSRLAYHSRPGLSRQTKRLFRFPHLNEKHPPPPPPRFFPPGAVRVLHSAAVPVIIYRIMFSVLQGALFPRPAP